MVACAYWILQEAIVAAQGVDSKLKAALGRDWKRKLSPLLYITAIVSTFWQAWISQVIYDAVALLWLVPDRRIERELANTED